MRENTLRGHCWKSFHLLIAASPHCSREQLDPQERRWFCAMWFLSNTTSFRTWDKLEFQHWWTIQYNAQLARNVSCSWSSSLFPVERLNHYTSKTRSSLKMIRPPCWQKLISSWYWGFLKLKSSILGNLLQEETRINVEFRLLPIKGKITPRRRIVFGLGYVLEFVPWTSESNSVLSTCIQPCQSHQILVRRTIISTLNRWLRRRVPVNFGLNTNG